MSRPDPYATEPESEAAWCGRRLIELLHDLAQVHCDLARLSTHDLKRREIPPDELLGIFSLRRRLVFRLARLNQELAPYRRDWNELISALQPSDQLRIAQLLAQVDRAVSAVLPAPQPATGEPERAHSTPAEDNPSAAEDSTTQGPAIFARRTR